MTASIAAFGLVPLLFATGPGSEIQRPLAIVVIGGLITSTFLSLLVIPAVFTGVDDLGLKFGKLWRRVTGGSADTPAAR
jgi:Cu/Ag efflux pump CusA